MLNLPTPITNYICALTVENQSPAYLLVSRDGRLSSWGGKLELYGVKELQKGEYVGKQVYFLEGLFPLNSSPMTLSCLKVEDGFSADVHLFSGDDGDWVLLLDATLKENQRKLIQQKGNDLSLLRQRYSKELNQLLGTKVAGNLAQRILPLQIKGERKDVTILLANICGFTSYIEDNPTDVVFGTLNLYISSMLRPILEQSGTVDKIMGDKVMALFGILPAAESPPAQAVQAALRIIEVVEDVNKLRQAVNLSTFEIGVGITSGWIDLGVVGNEERKIFSAVGYRVNLAMYFGDRSRSSEILIDENTFNKIGSMQRYFSITNSSEGEIIEQTQIYSYLIR